MNDDKEKIRIFFYNLGYSSDNMANTIEEAVKIAKDAGFQCSFYRGDNIIASWCPLSGYQKVVG